MHSMHEERHTTALGGIVSFHNQVPSHTPKGWTRLFHIYRGITTQGSGGIDRPPGPFYIYQYIKEKSRTAASGDGDIKYPFANCIPAASRAAPPPQGNEAACRLRPVLVDCLELQHRCVWPVHTTNKLRAGLRMRLECVACGRFSGESIVREQHQGYYRSSACHKAQLHP